MKIQTYYIRQDCLMGIEIDRVRKNISEAYSDGETYVCDYDNLKELKKCMTSSMLSKLENEEILTVKTNMNLNERIREMFYE